MDRLSEWVKLNHPTLLQEWAEDSNDMNSSGVGNISLTNWLDIFCPDALELYMADLWYCPICGTAMDGSPENLKCEEGHVWSWGKDEDGCLTFKEL